MSKLAEKIRKSIDEKVMRQGIMGTESVLIDIELTDKEVEHFKTLTDFDNEHYFWSIEDNILTISYTEEVYRTPQEKWQKKAGLISKSYKLNRDVVEKFSKTCEKVGTTQAKQLTKMMEEFISAND